MSTKTKSTPITLDQLPLIWGDQYQFFLDKLIPNCFCHNCPNVVTITNYTAEINDMYDLVLHGSCATCGGPVGRLFETGENPEYVSRIKFILRSKS